MSEKAIITPPKCELKNDAFLPVTECIFEQASPAGTPLEHTMSPFPKSPLTLIVDANALTMGMTSVGAVVGTDACPSGVKSTGSRKRARCVDDVPVDFALDAPKSRRIKTKHTSAKRPARMRYENMRMQIRMCIQNELCEGNRVWTPEIDRLIMDKPVDVSWDAYRSKIANGMFPTDELRGRWRWLIKHDGVAKSRKRWTRAEDEALLSGQDVPGRDKGACSDRLYKLRKAIRN